MKTFLKSIEAVSGSIFSSALELLNYISYMHLQDLSEEDDINIMSQYRHDLNEESDIYIVDREFNWTYIKTHEEGYLGPYFSMRH